MKKFTLFCSICICFCLNGKAQYWLLNGNTGNSATNFLGTTDGKPIIFKTNNFERMRILVNGRIGIGTTVPDTRFNIRVGNGVSLAKTDSFLLGSVSSYNVAFDQNEIQARYNGSASQLFFNYWGGDVYVGNHGTTNHTPALYTSSAGLVGVGGYSRPGYALNVNPTGNMGGIYIPDTHDSVALYATNSSYNFVIHAENTDYGNGIYATSTYGTGAEGYSEFREGVIGGTKGDELGSVGVYGYSTLNGYGVSGIVGSGVGVYGWSQDPDYYSGYFSGDVYAAGMFVSSDSKLKSNIKNAVGAMTIINQLQPKQYEFRHDGDYKLMNLPKGSHYGLLAQDVEKILPNLVKDSKFETSSASFHKKQEDKNTPVKNETIEFKALNYTELIPVIIKGMQEQQQLIQQQQQQIDELKAMVSSLTKNNTVSDAASKTLSGSYLMQNAPNPASKNTIIKANISSAVNHAQIIVYSSTGNTVSTYNLSKGLNTITVNAGSLASGSYSYSLIVDGTNVDTKTMIITK